MTLPARRKPATTLVVALGFVVVYGVCFALIERGLAFAPPLTFAGLRALLGGLALLPLLGRGNRSLLPRRSAIAPLLALALTSTTIAFGAMFLSPGRAGVGISSVLGNTQPLFTVALAVPLLGEPFSRSKMLALTLGFLGAVLVASPLLAAGNPYGLAGLALAGVASAAASVGNIVLKRMDIQGELLGVAAWQLLAGSVPLLVAGMVLERGRTVQFTAEFATLLLFLALIGTALATTVWYWLIEGEEVGRVSLYLFLVPVVGLGLAAMLLGEPVGGPQLLGALLAVAGIGVALRTPSAPGSRKR